MSPATKEQHKSVESTKTYTFDEAKALSLKFFNGDELATDVFLKKYALTLRDGKTYVEATPDDMWRRMAKAGASIEKDSEYWEKEFYAVFKDFKAVPQGSIMFALGNTYQKSSCSNCFVFKVEDSLESIFDAAKEMARTYSYRGGCGLDISPLRPTSAKVTNSAKTSSGAVSFMDFYSTVTRLIGIHNRRGALMLTIGVDHPDVELFTTIKHDLTKVTGANVSIRLSDAFMEAVEEGKDWEATFKTSHETITKKWKARDLWKVIVESATKTAEPGLLFWDNVLKNSPADCYEDEGFLTISTNPCSELPLAAWDACTLLSMNLTEYTRNDFSSEAYFDREAFARDARVATRFLDNVKTIDAEYVPLPQQREMCLKGRRIGMGIHGLGDTLANLGVVYDSAKGVSFIGELFEFYTKTVYQTSIELAEEKGAFPIFDAKKEKGHPFLERVGVAGIPRRNIACMTVAPTGSVSILSQTSSGIEPVFRNSYTRRVKLAHEMKAKEGEKVFVDIVGDKWLEYDVFHHNVRRYLDMVVGDKTLPKEFVTSDQIDWKKRVEIQAAITKWLDHSASSTINLPKGTTTDTVSKIYFEAWKSGCKGITVYVDGCRDGVLITEEETRAKKYTAIERPAKVECDIYNITAEGQKWVVIVGLVENKPYEVFCGKPKKVEIGSKVSKGYLEKEARGKYSLHIGEDTIIHDVGEMFDGVQGALTRLISTSLRHSVDIQFVVQQLEKSDGNVSSFSKAVARVLKKYIQDGTKEDGVTCDECKQDALVRENGCTICKQCGASKCS